MSVNVSRRVTAACPGCPSARHPVVATVPPESRLRREEEVAEVRVDDERAVIAALVRYATAIDTKDWALLAGCFFPAAKFTAGSLVLDGVDEIVEYMRAAHHHIDGSQHRLSNFAIRLSDDGRTAHSTTYLDALIVHRAHRDGPTLRVVSTYHDVFECAGDAWRIAKRSVSSLWREGSPTILGPTVD